jgi:integrase
VFGHKNGLPYFPNYFADRWAKLCTEAGVRVIALHDARHTNANVGAEAGVGIKVMQARLGHSDPTILTKIYMSLGRRAGRLRRRSHRRAVRLTNHDGAA